ncbi:hypothetical protein C1645_880355 [Glomus cerebriforme]|uniref:Uncharacterized protein n=1 Tax=Glomus cerebriforme TaxID=658196 RepID=A0A397SI82_9GLOM|nr:hypothetical protein C1645_880355 [Glomus cerebriforme]
MSDKEIIEVIIREYGISSLIKLEITNTLSEIREQLEQDSTIGMDDTLLFLDSESFEISRKKEADCRLKDLITNNDTNHTIYLRNHKCSINYIKCKLELEYGRILNPDNAKINIADKRAFVIRDRDIESTDPEETSCDDEIRINSKKSWENKIDSFLNAGAEMINFGSARINFSIMQSKNQRVEKSYSCKYTKVPKKVLKFEKIEPTEEFVNYVKDAIKSNNREKFKEIYGKFGQFVPKKVTLGGMIYVVSEGESNEYSEQKNFGINPKIDTHAIPGANIQAESGFNLNRSNKKSTSKEKIRRYLLGGEPQDPENIDKKEWIGSLSDHKTWKCIEFQNPINIFQLLDDSLRKEVYEFFGKKVLYSDVMKYDRQLDYGERVIIPLPLQGKICKTIENEDAKCNVFATIVCDDKKKNDFFNYQIYHPKNENPRLIIHCYQRKQNSQKPHNLKIGFMIIGYDVDFNNCILNDDGIKLEVHDEAYLNSNNQNNQNLAHEIEFDFNFDDVNSFLGIPVLSESNSILVGHYFFKKENKIAAMLFSYNLNKNKYVKLPNLRFQVLTISGYSRTTCGKISFKKRLMGWGKYIDIEDIEKRWAEKYIPKYISVYSENCGPVFLKQKKKEIKLKRADCKCKGACPFCKNRPSESNVKCTYFVSNTSDESKSHHNFM